MLDIIALVFLTSPAPPVYGQAIWRQIVGPNAILLYKDASKDFYYCTWAIEFDLPNLGAFDFVKDRPLAFRIRWKREHAEGVKPGFFLQVIINGRNFPFTIVRVNPEPVLTDVEGEFAGGIPIQTPRDLWQRLADAKSFRVYLPNGEFKDAETSDFNRASQALLRCLNEASDLNKAASR